MGKKVSFKVQRELDAIEVVLERLKTEKKQHFVRHYDGLIERKIQFCLDNCKTKKDYDVVEKMIEKLNI